jgi:hypothetical protein
MKTTIGGLTAEIRTEHLPIRSTVLLLGKPVGSIFYCFLLSRTLSIFCWIKDCMTAVKTFIGRIKSSNSYLIFAYYKRDNAFRNTGSAVIPFLGMFDVLEYY